MCWPVHPLRLDLGGRLKAEVWLCPGRRHRLALLVVVILVLLAYVEFGPAAHEVA